MIIGDLDLGKLDVDEKAQVFSNGVCRLAQALEIEPVMFVAMLKWITETAESALEECDCGNCNPSQNATKH